MPKILVWQIDKFGHSIIYAILSVCLLIVFSKQYNQTNKRFQISVLIIFIGVFYGGIMEILQNNIFINRSGNWYDFIANTIGAVLGVFIYPIINKLLPIKRWFKIV
jgi:VanZ family protein